MQDELFIRVLPSLNPLSPESLVCWSLLAEKSSKDSINSEVECTLATLGESIVTEGFDVSSFTSTVTVPGELASLWRLQVNDGQKKRLAAVLPFMLEEQFAVNIETIHFATTKPDSYNKVLAVAIAHLDMEYLLALLDDTGIQPLRVYSEANLTIFQQKECFLLMDGSSYILGLEGVAPVCLTDNSVRGVLGQLSTETVTKLSVIEALQSSVPRLPEIQQWIVESNLESRAEQSPYSVTGLLKAMYRSGIGDSRLINLRSGCYQVGASKPENQEILKNIAAMASVWLVSSLLFLGYSGTYFAEKKREYWIKTAEVYLDAFPHDQSMLAAVKQGNSAISIEPRLKSRLQQPEKGAGTSVLMMLQALSQAVDAVDGVSIDPVFYDFDATAGQLVLEFSATELEQVNQLQTALQESGLGVHLDNARQVKNKVMARLTIRSNG
ncbi:type II secretion system protein GspL [Endozoicomonas sp. ALB115]|uniref:type II secretion system protein GspL n=1 Tax=Endozoicomonas sp. ALB115 TaxID=3403074 RepID=UPI003BB731CA